MHEGVQKWLSAPGRISLSITYHRVNSWFYTVCIWEIGSVFLFSQHAAAIGLCDIFRWDGMIEAIDDADGLGTFVGDNLRRAEEGVGHGIAVGVLLGASDEEEDDAAGFSLGEVSLPCLGLGGDGGLALPMEEVAVDGVVFVEGGVGEFFL